MSDSPGLVDFAIGLVNSVINLPDRQVNFFEEFKLQKNCEINLLVKTFLGLVEMIHCLLLPPCSRHKVQGTTKFLLKMLFFYGNQSLENISFCTFTKLYKCK